MTLAAAAASATTISLDRRASTTSTSTASTASTRRIPLPSVPPTSSTASSTAAAAMPISAQLPSSMAKSTIYKRHEARLARSQALKEDPRPAAVRVLSLLPGFRAVVPQFVPSDDHNHNNGKDARQSFGAFSEDTLFTTTTAATAAGSDGSQQSTTALSSPLRNLVAAGVAATIANAAFGIADNHAARSRSVFPPATSATALLSIASNGRSAIHATTASSARANPFGMTQTPTITMTEAGDITFSSQSSSATSAAGKSSRRQMQTARAGGAIIDASRAPQSGAVNFAKSIARTSAVFATRAAVQQQQQRLFSGETNRTADASILANLTAGVVAGAFYMVPSARPASSATAVVLQRRMSPHVLAANSWPAPSVANVAAREMATTFLYFQMYDVIKCQLNGSVAAAAAGGGGGVTDNGESNATYTTTMTTSAVAGAITGSATHMLRGVLSSQHGIGMARNSIMVAPKHALLFATYEALVQAMKMQPLSVA